ncbi:MAG TPA: DUF4199 domain-containing protein [Flavobacterium sp.]|jgi:hypothetical protein
MNEIIKRNGITYGIVLGIFSMLVTTLIYVIDLSLFTSMWVGIVSLIIFLIIGIILLIKTKKDFNGIISFKEAFTTFFLAAAIGSTISVLYNILLFNVIDPEAKTIVNDMMIKYSVDMMEKFGAPASSINEAVAEMRKVDNYSPFSLLKGLMFSLVFSAILGLILALIFKSKPAYKE